MSLFHLRQAADVVRHGGVIAYPTEAVYGLGCDPLNGAAVHRLLALKDRPVERGLILLGADLSQLEPYIRVTADERQRMLASWPGPVTWLVPASDRVPEWIRGNHASVAVRVSGHPDARRLAALSGVPLVSTSANVSGRPPARNRFQVARALGHAVDFVVTGQCDLAARPSTIKDIKTGQVVRA